MMQIEIDNTTEFYRGHTRLRAIKGDKVINWIIPDRLLRNIDLSNLIVQELITEANNDAVSIGPSRERQTPTC